MNNRILGLLMLFSLCFKLNAQNFKKIDSLTLQLKTSPIDTNRINVLYNLGLELGNSKPDKAMQYQMEAFNIANKLNNKRYVSLCLNSIGGILEDKGDFSGSLKYFSQSLAIRKQLGNQKGIASTIHNMGIAFENLGMYDSALHYYFMDAKIRVKLTDKRELASSYIGIGNVNDIQGNFAISLKYYRQATSIYNLYNDSGNRAIVYENIGNVYKHLNNDDSALFYYKISAKTLENIGNLTELASLYNNIGTVYEEKKNYTGAANCFFKSLKLHTDLGNLEGITEVNSNIGVLYKSQEMYKEALHYFKAAQDTAEKINAKESLLLIYKSMAEIFAIQKRYADAYLFYKQYSDLNDTLSEKTKTKQISELQIKYETEKKEQELKDQAQISKQKTMQLQISIAASILIILLAGFLIYNYNQRIKARDLLARKNEEINNQKINALLTEQDIKFAAAMLEGQEYERKRIAEDLHDRLGVMLSTVKLHFSAIRSDIKEKISPSLQQSDIAEKLLDDACAEVRQIAHSMATGVLAQSGLQVALLDLKDALEKSNRIKFNLESYRMDDRLDSQLEISVYRILQELIGNVLKHADAKEITVSLNRHDKSLNIIVEDDGKGFNKDEAMKQDGMGLKNIEARVHSLNGVLSMDSMPGRGSTIIIDIPFDQENALI